MKTAYVVLWLLLAAPASAVAGDLRAELVGGPRDDAGRLVLTVPSEREIDLALRLTNTGEEPAEVVLSNYPAYLHVKLSVVRIGPEGARTKTEPYGDLYPGVERKPPNDVKHALAPGESIERSLDRLLSEGHLLETFARWGGPGWAELRSRGFGALREPGEYEIVGMYVADAETKANPIETAPLRAVVRWRFPWDDAARRTARAQVIAVGEVVQVKATIQPPGDPGGWQVYALEEPEETLRGRPGKATPFLVRFPTHDAVTWHLEGRRLVYLSADEEGLLHSDEASIVEATEAAVADAKARLAFLDLLAAEAIRVDPAAAKAVADLLADLGERPEARTVAANALRNLGPAAIPALAARVGAGGGLPASLLAEVTGESFPDARGWRIYARYVAAGAR